MANMKKVLEIANSIDTDEICYEYIGIRVQESPEGLEVGDTVYHCSHIWDDGEDTGEELNGVCAMNINRLDWIVKDGMEYFGNTIIVLGGNSAEFGEDLGELVMQEPEVLAIYNV